MKILTIRGKNLASLEKEFEVDFTTEPLRSAGIFAITGSTGSGKSTLLDALCIALFDTSPRTNRASESISIRDVGDKTIQQGDSRTILRRGAVDGFAEVDFISLGGETFRARWTVRRARNKADGSLQSSEIRLNNLSTGKEEQGTKTELLNKISGLIGLTFDQFTRAVLLSQGDFATFLKAKQAEKAELLEKLTGTSIFSDISIAIYEKAKEAEAKWNILNERIQGVELLSDEQMTAFDVEKKEIHNECAALKKDADLRLAQLKWLEEKNRLCDQIRQAETDYASALKTIEDAGQRFETIAQIESALSIRETFGLLKNVQKQLSGYKTNLLSAQNERETNSRRLAEAQQLVAVHENEQLQLQEKQKEITPQIIRARELDVRIKTAKATMDDAQTEYAAAQSTFNKTIQNLSALKQTFTQAEKNLSTLNQWFEVNKQYESITQRTDLLISLTNDAQTAGKQREQNQKTLVSSRAILEEKLKQMEKLKQEAERLNQLLPAEIAALRDQLTEGRPCPVCGSTVHPVAKTEQIHQLKEQELKKAKENMAKQTETLATDIESRKNEITRLTTQVENYTDLYDKAYNSLEFHLSELPDWQEIFNRAELTTHLQTIAKQWDVNTRNLTRTKEEINKLVALIESEENKLKEVADNLTVKTTRLADFRSVATQLAAERATVLHGKPVDDAERYFVERQNSINDKLKKATETQNALIAKQESLNGVIGQIQTLIRQSEEKREEWQNEVETWLKERENFNYGLLTELLEKNTAWIQTEKQALQSLTQAGTTTQATLAERRKNLEQHHQSGTKPEEESKEVIQASLEEKNAAIESRSKRKAEIETLLTSNEKSKAQIKGLEKELNEKGAITENWKKLNHLLGSANGNKFKEIAQRYTLETLLLYANRHLQELAPRYQLQSMNDKLGLQIIDTDMLNEVRSIHSLSGGESFLTSLALALGLSSLSSNRMKIESLFIDEGFGSLDSDTLRVAMDALEHLQTQGRKIGVISHVTEMTERIAVRIHVRKTANDKSEIDMN